MKIFLMSLICAFSGCASIRDADDDLARRCRKYFAMDPKSEVNAVSIRNAILKMIPMGSDEDVIKARLDESGIGKDGLSSYFPVDSEGRLVCRVEFDRRTFGFVKKSYGVLFRLNSEKKLKDVAVEEWLTGL